MATSVFLFGKLPAHGDFVARGLGPAAREAWDATGSALMEALRIAAADGFDASHVAAPPWRFVTEAGDGWRAGALAPSVDSVGRRFLVAVGTGGLPPASAAAAGLSLAEAAEALIYQALGSGLDADALHAACTERLEGLYADLLGPATALDAPPRAPGIWWTLGSAGCAPTVIRAGAPPADLLARTVAAAHSAEPVS